MNIIQEINRARQPGGIESLGRRLANQALGATNLPGSPEIVSQNLEGIYGYFLANLLQSTNSIPVKPLWLCFMDTIPNTSQRASELDQHYGGAPHELALGHTAALAGIDMRGAKAALLCQECSVPGEEFSVSRPGNQTGGFIAGGVGAPRTSFSTAKIAYLETNYSFTDYVIRPWNIVSSFESLKLAPRTNITMINFAKAGSDTQFKPRKIITLHGCVPVSIESEPYTYSGNDMVVRETQWHFDSYTVKSGQLITSSNLLGTLSRVFNTDSIEDIGDSALTAAGGLIANTLTNLAGDFGSAVEGRLGITDPRSIASTNRAIAASNRSVAASIGSNDFVQSTPQPDDVVPPADDTVSNLVFNNDPQNNKTIQEVTQDQIQVAKNLPGFEEVLPRPLDTPISGRNLQLAQDDVIIDQNDTPTNLLGVQDDVKVNSDDVVSNLALESDVKIDQDDRL